VSALALWLMATAGRLAPSASQPASFAKATPTSVSAWIKPSVWSGCWARRGARSVPRPCWRALSEFRRNPSITTRGRFPCRVAR